MWLIWRLVMWYNFLWHLFCCGTKLLLTFSFHLYCFLLKLIFWSPSLTLNVIKNWYHVLIFSLYLLSQDHAYDFASILPIYWWTVLQSRVIPAKERWMIQFLSMKHKKYMYYQFCSVPSIFLFKTFKTKGLIPLVAGKVVY